jgi:signal transduction histidine kinase/ActR/RegA family two-component response regulator
VKSSNTALAIVPAPLKAQRCAFAICIALFGTFCALIPFSRIALPRVEPFVPIYDSTLALNNVVTAGLLLVGFSRSRLRAVLVLASGYLFTSLMALPHMAAFPGLFSSNGLLGAGPQTSAWLNVFRQGVFPLVVIGYAVLKGREAKTVQSLPNPSAHAVPTAVATVAGVCLLTILATSGHRLLPQIVDGDSYTTAMVAVSVQLCLFSLVALAVLVSRRPYSILDLWLMVVLCAWVFGIALSMVINTGRFDLGFYVGRLYGLFAASVVPIVFLVEAGRLWGRLDEVRAIADQRNAELMRSREQLAQAQRLEAIGQLTGGIAHDFNYLLTVVIGNLDLISRARGDPEKIERLVQNAMMAARRGEHLVRQLLTYARRQINQPQTVNLNQLITNTENLVRRAIGEQIEVVSLLIPLLAPVEIDPAQFEAAILNLAINSRDAMAEGGRITIETHNVTVDRQHTADDPDVTPGPYVMIAVSDSGAGMSAAVQARAFDPFFTTKEVGKGSGLGLSQVYGFAKTAGGFVRIYSELGIGTTVKLYLPQSANRAASRKSSAETAFPSTGGGTILLVEDDEDVLAVTANSLSELGYEVVTAPDAAQAMEILRGDQPIDLLFSDVIIPGGTNGAQLAVTARRVRPGLKVLLGSGYTAAALSLEHGLPDNLNVVGKPYQRDELEKNSDWRSAASRPMGPS